MTKFPEGNAIVYCEDAFNTPNGKTAHGLIRRSHRYNILCIIDSKYAGNDSGIILDDKKNNIPVVENLNSALSFARTSATEITHFVIGIAPDGGRLSPAAREEVKRAIQAGLNIDCGLHDFLSEDNEILVMAKNMNVQIRDVRKTPPRNMLHFFEGKIEHVKSLKIAVLGTDSAIGKRTTAWILADALNAKGISTVMIGTGQTAWMQGANYSLILDSLINDFVSGEIEHAVWSAWNDSKPEVIIIEGQGSLMNPAYPGGLEILAAGRPDIIILQHAPARGDYDGFPGYPIHPLKKQIEAIELISGKPVVMITINHENLKKEELHQICADIEFSVQLPVSDVLAQGSEKMVKIVTSFLKTKNNL